MHRDYFKTPHPIPNVAYSDVLNLLERGKVREAEVLAGELKGEEREKALALVYLQQGRVNRALDMLLRLYYTKGHRDDVARMVAHAFIRRLDFATAKDFLEKIREKTVDDYFWLFISALFLGDPTSARTYLHYAREKDPKRAAELTREAYKLIVLPARNLTDNQKMELLKRIESYFKEGGANL